MADEAITNEERRADFSLSRRSRLCSLKTRKKEREIYIYADNETNSDKPIGGGGTDIGAYERCPSIRTSTRTRTSTSYSSTPTSHYTYCISPIHICHNTSSSSFKYKKKMLTLPFGFAKNPRWKTVRRAPS